MLAQRALTTLRDTLSRESGFLKVHAAEALISLGHAGVAYAELASMPPEAHGVRPTRIGLWRVLATMSSGEKRDYWIARIVEAFLDPAGTDRIHAAETLFKLGERPSFHMREAARGMLPAASGADRVFLLAILHTPGDAMALAELLVALRDNDPLTRLRAAFVISRFAPAEAGALATLAETANSESPSTMAYPHVLGFALAAHGPGFTSAPWSAALRHLAREGRGSAAAIKALIGHWKIEDLPELGSFLESPDASTRIAAATAIYRLTGGTDLQ